MSNAPSFYFAAKPFEPHPYAPLARAQPRAQRRQRRRLRLAIVPSMRRRQAGLEGAR
jgi:hypothetical protein